LRIYDSTGSLLYSNDDINYPSNVNSLLSFTANYSGTYYVAAGAYNDSYSGSYSLSVSLNAPPAPATHSQLAAYLTDGYWNDTSRTARYFDTSGDNTITVNITGLTTQGQDLARWALEVWETVVNLDFVETSGVADITFDDNDSGAYATSSTSGFGGGTIISSNVNVSTGWLASSGTQIGTYSLQTYIHEIGHALGLGHQGGYNGAATYGVDETFSNDSWQLSVMSYFDQADNTTTNASFAYVVSLMMADIIAGQTLYGASTVTNGNTTWGANTNLGGYWGILLGALFDGDSQPSVAGNPMAFTIFDNGGIDTLDLSTSSNHNNVDMRGGQFSNVNGLVGNIGIADGTVLENLIGGSGNDTIIGNDADNELTGGAGNDSVDGGDGNDTAAINDTRASVTVTDLGGGIVRIVSSDGTDTFENVENFRFTDGSVSLAVLLGNNVITGTSARDVLIGTSGVDNILGLAGHDRLDGGDGADVIEGGDGNDEILGRAGDDSLLGEEGNDTIAASDGNDTVYGGAGDDSLGGGFGNDSVYGGEGRDVIGSGSGRDLIEAENGDDVASGGWGYDTVYGGDGNDTLAGSYDADSVFGGAGNDSMGGGTGDDTMYAGAGNDQVGAGEDNDLIYGEDGHDFLGGGSGNDTLYGGADNDTINGGTGNDSLIGGDGVDQFVFNSLTNGEYDRISDFENGVDNIRMHGVGSGGQAARFAELSLSSVSGGVEISYAGHTILLEGHAIGDIDQSDFIFV
jgi:serralysin